MERTGEFQIRVLGEVGKLSLTPQNYDVRDIKYFLEIIEDILYPGEGKERPLIAFNIAEGSVRHIFKTGMQAIISINAVLTSIRETSSIDFLDLKTGTAIEGIQKLAYQKNFSFELTTSLGNTDKLDINPTTRFVRSENVWVDAEFYFYGKLTNAGGKNKANIHIDTRDFGVIKIDTPKDFLAQKEDNFLYRNYGVRAAGKQNLETGDIDRNSLSFLELLDYAPAFDEKYLRGLINKARNQWKGVDVDKWVRELRGEYV